MTWTAEISSVNQRLQFGAESTSALGTSVSASKLVECFDLVPGINADVSFYRPSGRKYDNTQEENTEWMEWTQGGNMDYNGAIYPLASIMGSVAPTAHGGSATAKDWTFTPPVTGSIVPQTYTIEQGDSVSARKSTYCIWTQWGYKGTRKDFSCSGKLMSQPITTGITLTASPTAVALSPMVSKHFNVYLDPTSGALGSTLLTRVLSIEYSMDNVYGPLWVLNRSTVGWTAHVDMAPKCTFKMKLEADSTAIGYIATYLQGGATAYVRVSGQGPQIASDGPSTVNATFQHDMALKFDKPDQFGDEQGVYAIQYNCTVVEDPSWSSGKAQTITVTNLIASL